MGIEGCKSASGIIITTQVLGTTKCTVTVPEQANLSGLTFTNGGAGTTREITVDISIASDIEYTEHAGTGLGACKNGSSGTGSYSGTAKFTGASGEHKGIWYA